MPRGGRRSGTTGKAYSNRSDLQGAKLPAQPYPMGGNVGYGQGGALQQAQAAVPVGPPPTPAAAGPGPQGGPQPPPGPMPGSMGAFNRPTERPGEPITHGLPTGPGAGPEVLPPAPTDTAGTVLQRMAATPFASAEIRALANQFMR